MHGASDDDRAFLEAFEACRVPPIDFHHREHVKLAYVCLCEAGHPSAAHARVRTALVGFIRHNGVPETKYHETITRAWILAVDYFMQKAAPVSCDSFDAFIAADPRLLDASIMLTHYSKDRLFSDEARSGFVEPDLDPIPRRDLARADLRLPVRARGRRASGRGSRARAATASRR